MSLEFIEAEASAYHGYLRDRASASTVQEVLGLPDTDDGKSEWYWIRLPNGDLVLAVYPLGNAYEKISQEIRI